MKRLAISIFVMLLSACSATGPVFSPASPPNQDQALLYFYRPDAHALSARTLDVKLDAEPWVSLSNNSYAAKYVLPGKHTITTQWSQWLLDNSKLQEPLQISMLMQAGKAYYIRLNSSATLTSYNVTTIRWQLSVVPESEANSQIANTKSQ